MEKTKSKFFVSPRTSQNSNYSQTDSIKGTVQYTFLENNYNNFMYELIGETKGPIYQRGADSELTREKNFLHYKINDTKYLSLDSDITSGIQNFYKHTKKKNI